MVQRITKTVARAAIDAGVAAVCLPTALLLHFDGRIPFLWGGQLPRLLVVVVGAKVVAGAVIGAHNRMWRYTSLREGMVLAGTAAMSLFWLLVMRWVGYLPLTEGLLVTDAILFLLGTSGIRILRRAQVTYMIRRRAGNTVPAPRTLVVGAGDTAYSLLADLDNGRKDWDVVGLLDDSRSKQGMLLLGHPVLGRTTELERIVKRESIRHVVIAMPSAPRTVVRDLIFRAQSQGATVQAVPALEELLKARPHAKAVTLNDLVDSAEVKRTLLSRVHRPHDQPLVLVTGGAGYIGSHVVKKLLDRGCSVRVLDNFTYGEGGLAALRGHGDLDVVHGDISSIRDVVAAIKDVDSVIALAALVGDPACGLNAEETLNLNYEATKVLVEAANFYGIRRLVFASSCSVYGAADNELLHEGSSLNPVSLYARTRIMSEDVLFARCGDVEPVVLRLSTVFGLSPRMRFDLVVNTLTIRALVNRRIQVFGGDQWRPFVHCKDAAEAFTMAALAPSEAVKGQVFNVGGSDMNYTISQVGEIVAREVGDVEVVTVDDVEDRRNYRVDFSKIETVLGFQRSYDLGAGIREMIEGVRADQRLRDFENPAYSNVRWLKDRFEQEDLLESTRAPALAEVGKPLLRRA